MGQRGRPRHPDVLTPREQDVLALIRDGLTNEQIAERLNIDFETAKSHVAAILAKLGVATREEAAAWQTEAKYRQHPLSQMLRWLLLAAAGAAILGLVLLIWGVLLSGSGDRTAAAGPAWPDCAAAETRGFATGIHFLDGRTCEITTIAGTEMVERSPIWSRDGRYIAFLGDAGQGDADIFIVDTTSGNVSRITNSGATKDDLTWTADDDLAYSSIDRSQGDTYDLMLVSVNGETHVLASGLYCLGDIAASAPDELVYGYGCGLDGKIFLTNIATGETHTVVDYSVYGVSSSPNGESLLFSCPTMSNGGPPPSCVKRGDEDPQLISSAMFPQPDFVPADVAPAFWGQDGSILLIDGEDARVYVLPAGTTTGAVYTAPPGFQPLNVNWASSSVVSFGRCTGPSLPPNTAAVGPCPDEQTLSVKLATGEEKVVVDADCYTVTTWSPDGSRLAIVVPANKGCGV
jgi:DNA-binding CsgD family transcriptional regulator